jgi:GNAT superfamily N-acetyltransferase
LTSKITWLVFLATAKHLRSQGIGTEHMRRLKELIGCQQGAGSVIVFEIESTHARDLAMLDPADQSSRTARRRFYERLGAHTYGGHYEMLPFIQGQPITAAHLMWFGVRRWPMAQAIELIYHCGLFPSIPHR